MKAVDALVRDLTFRADMKGGCWFTRRGSKVGLIVPSMYGPLTWLRSYHQNTLNEALAAELVVVGRDLGPLPPYEYGGERWRWSNRVEGRSIALAGGGS